ncbi:hypothetical protein [Janthinobacterium agaricidamnosum]|uniref:Transmembrane protein n=1 Tax=Janthinobacterium agaricidamnosum NBRC 102515 = DSM 9628 TaxID=1349767 RepID=W0VC99_9BURK|nr:hypothetical protein [Janthinobacterium agaricidamnosum]CDG85290.1 transmembrane protein [Janthinobacterium agaricidamnosum NBRC 102515 = DSM 9628]
MLKLSLPAIVVSCVVALVLTACSPKFDWRDYHSPDAPYTALFPSKPATFSRDIDLDGVKVNMTMTASDIDGITFAVASALMANPAQAQAALLAMKTALLRNINGVVKSDKAASAAISSGTGSSQNATIEIQASGTQNGKPILLIGRFVARDNRIYQIIILGEEKHLSRENIDTFMDSIKLN